MFELKVTDKEDLPIMYWLFKNLHTKTASNVFKMIHSHAECFHEKN